MNYTDAFSLAASIWNGDKFLLESANDTGQKQIKVTAQLVAKYLLNFLSENQRSEQYILPFAGIVDSAEIKLSSITEGDLGVAVWYVSSEGRFAVSAKDSLSIGKPKSLYDNWNGRNSYNDGFKPRSGKLFIRTDDDVPFWYNGTEMRQLKIGS